MKGGCGMSVAFRQFGSLVRLSFLELWRRNEIFAFLLLALALMVPLSSASPFGASGASRYLDEIALLLIWAFSLFIALGTGSRLFPPEFDSRTIYPLLAKPVSRGRLLIGKYLGAVAATVSAVLFFYAIYLGSTLLRGGSISAEILQGIALHLVFAAFAVAVALLFSLLVSRGASLVLSGILLVGMFFFGRRLLDYSESVAFPVNWLVRAFYVVFPHVEFLDMRQRMIHGWGAVDCGVFAVVLLYAAVYISLLLSVSVLLLKRRKL